MIVTVNLKDFPAAKLQAYGVEAIHPDDFLLDLLDLAPGAIASVVVEQAAGLKNPPRTVQDLLGTLRDQGLVQSVAKLHEVLGTVAG